MHSSCRIAFPRELLFPSISLHNMKRENNNKVFALIYLLSSNIRKNTTSKTHSVVLFNCFLHIENPFIVAQTINPLAFNYFPQFPLISPCNFSELKKPFVTAPIIPTTAAARLLVGQKTFRCPIFFLLLGGGGGTSAHQKGRRQERTKKSPWRRKLRETKRAAAPRARQQQEPAT